MQDPEIWNIISLHLAGKESPEEKDKFLKWLNQSEKNKTLFHSLKMTWDGIDNDKQDSLNEEGRSTFFSKFTKEKIKSFVYKQTIGNLVGFIVGMWVTTMFSHYVLERRGLQNLFGLAGRKKVAVNDIPEWMQSIISILVGFIALELINHFFQSKKHLIIWRFLKKKYNTLILKNS